MGEKLANKDCTLRIKERRGGKRAKSVGSGEIVLARDAVLLFGDQNIETGVREGYVVQRLSGERKSDPRFLQPSLLSRRLLQWTDGCHFIR